MGSVAHSCDKRPRHIWSLVEKLVSYHDSTHPWQILLSSKQGIFTVQKNKFLMSLHHSLIRGVLIQSCCTGAKYFTKYVFCHPQFSCVIQNIENYCAILILFVYVEYYQNNHFYRVKINFLKFYFTGTIIFNILDNTTEFYMTNYIIGEIFSSGGATLYKKPSDQTVS